MRLVVIVAVGLWPLVMPEKVTRPLESMLTVPIVEVPLQS